MTDYTKLVEALRCELHYTSCPETNCKYICHDTFCDTYRLMVDAADAIEALNRLVDLNTERCEGLRKQLREAQEQYEKNINELEKELSFSESTYEEFQIVAATQNALLAKQLPKRGEWIYKPKDAIEMMFTLPKCSVCGHESSDANNYCPNCGAKMNGEQNVE